MSSHDARPAQPQFEEIGGQRLPLGGINGYVGVRGKQGRKKDKFQGVTPRKQHRTAHFATSQEAALALAQLKEDLELGMLQASSSHKKPASLDAAATAISRSHARPRAVAHGQLGRSARPRAPRPGPARRARCAAASLLPTAGRNVQSDSIEFNFENFNFKHKNI